MQVLRHDKRRINILLGWDAKGSENVLVECCEGCASPNVLLILPQDVLLITFLII